MNLTEKEKGYICGLMDGEGSSYLNKHGYPRLEKDVTLFFFYPKIAIEMYNKPIMDWFHSLLKRLEIKHGYYHDNKRDAYRIHINTEEDIKRFWKTFEGTIRLQPEEGYIGCVLSTDKNISMGKERKKVLDLLKKNQPIGISKLATLAGKAPSTIAEHLNYLLINNLVYREGKQPKTKYFVK